MGGDRANANWHADVFAGIQWSKSVNGMIRNCVRRVNAVDCEYIYVLTIRTWKWSDSWFSFRFEYFYEILVLRKILNNLNLHSSSGWKQKRIVNVQKFINSSKEKLKESEWIWKDISNQVKWLIKWFQVNLERSQIIIS